MVGKDCGSFTLKACDELSVATSLAMARSKHTVFPLPVGALIIMLVSEL